MVYSLCTLPAPRYPFKSVDVWEEMVMVNPLDMFSLRMAYLTALKWGHRPWTKSLLERVVPFWKPDMALYG